MGGFRLSDSWSGVQYYTEMWGPAAPSVKNVGAGIKFQVLDRQLEISDPGDKLRVLKISTLPTNFP